MSHPLLPTLPPLELGAGARTRWGGVEGPVGALVAGALARTLPCPVLAVVASEAEARTWEAVLRDLLSPEGIAVRHFPGREVLPYDTYSPPADLVAERFAHLARMAQEKRLLLLVDAATLSERLPPPEHVLREAIVLDVGQHADRDDLRRRLVAAGYRPVSQIEEPGELAVRGAVLDVFPMSELKPLRIEFLDETIASLRRFDPSDQRSLSTRVEGVRILPAREFPLDEESREHFLRAFRARVGSGAELRGLAQRLAAGDVPEGLEAYLSLFFPNTAHLVDYLPIPPLVAWFPGSQEALESHHDAVVAHYERHRGDYDRPPLAPEEVVWTRNLLEDRLAKGPRLELLREAPPGVWDLGGRPATGIEPAQDEDVLARNLLGWIRDGGRVIVSGHAPIRELGLRRALAVLDPAIEPATRRKWSELTAAAGSIEFVPVRLDGQASQGSLLFVSLEGASDVASVRETSVRRRPKGRDLEALLRDLTDLVEGAPVVHEEHGVGRYRGLVHLDVDGIRQEFLLLEYLGGDRLYVPVTQLARLSRYVGGGETDAPWHRLGGHEWKRLRDKGERHIHDVAAELLALEARRRTVEAPILEAARTELEACARAFPYTLTEDQDNALHAVLADLARPRPMHRLLCGDVGFGKTEIALRAAYVTAALGRQVVVLAPTTLLARQHHETFVERLSPFGIRVGLLSRLRTERERAAVRAAFARGELDVLVTTHAILSGELHPPRLGLLVIDEEQRFGVRQKEALRRLQAEVHTLLLTATPIPRTLHMALGGLVDLSLLATPPPGRLAVATSLGLWDDGMLAEAIEREHRRGGQVYVVHPTIEGIDALARRIAALAPGLELRIAHGEMPVKLLEATVEDFYHGRFPILVSTKIIGHGLDIPNANTLIVNHAHRFGLGELHQLRGRVGRSQHRAYAYFLVPTLTGLPAEAKARLEALTNHQDPGAGFLLAVQDLEIRGAGRLLGEEQSGVIDDLGFGLYTQILEETVRRLGGEPVSTTLPTQGGEIQVHATALLPESYLPDVGLRLLAYRRLGEARSEEDFRLIVDEFRDRFGPLPREAQRLVEIMRLGVRARRLGIHRLDLHSRGGSVEFGPSTSVDPTCLVTLVSGEPKRFRFEPPRRLKILGEWPDPDARLAFVGELLERLLPRTTTVTDHVDA